MPARALDCCRKFAFDCNVPGYKTLTKCVVGGGTKALPNFGLSLCHSYLCHSYCTVVDFWKCTLSKTSLVLVWRIKKKNSPDCCCVLSVVGLLRAKAFVWLRTVRLYKEDPGFQACLVSFVRLVWLPCCSPPTDSQRTQLIQRIWWFTLSVGECCEAATHGLRPV